MLHSIGNAHQNWIYNFLSVSKYHVELLFRHFKNKNIRTLFLSEALKAQTGDSNQVCLSFDDGFADNWFYLFPLLKKYQLKATIFINPEFISESETVRELNPNKPCTGYLNWVEIIEMQKSGLVDFQSHSMSHTWHFTSNKIIDYYLPLSFNGINYKPYPWVSWNHKPELKPFSFTNQEYIYPDALPVFENGRSLGIRKYFPDPGPISEIVNLINQLKPTLTNQNYKKVITEQIDLNKITVTGKYETDIEMEERYRYELEQSKKTIEKKLEKEVEIICWPGGALNQTSLKIASDVGYKAFTINEGKEVPDSGMVALKRSGMSDSLGFRNEIVGPAWYPRVLISNLPGKTIDINILRLEKLIRRSIFLLKKSIG